MRIRSKLTALLAAGATVLTATVLLPRANASAAGANTLLLLELASLALGLGALCLLRQRQLAERRSDD